MKLYKILLCSIIFTFAVSICLAQDVAATLNFMSRNEILWRQFKSNGAQLDRLSHVIAQNLSEIRKQSVKIWIQTNATSYADAKENEKSAYQRAQAVQKLLSEKYNLLPSNFKITAYITPIRNLPDAVVVSLEKQHAVAAKTPQTEPRAVVKRNTLAESDMQPTTVTQTPVVSPILSNTEPDNKPRNFVPVPKPPKPNDESVKPVKAKQNY